MKLIAIIATAVMAIGLYTAAEASTVSEAKHEVTCQQSGYVRPCNACKGSGRVGAAPCVVCKGWGRVPN